MRVVWAMNLVGRIGAIAETGAGGKGWSAEGGGLGV